MKGRALTYAEIRETAKEAAREIEQGWPEWKQALSKRAPATARADEGEPDVDRRDDE